MANENPLWGEERIANELLLKLGIRSRHERTVSKYLRKRPLGQPRGDQRWSTFLMNHQRAILACDFFIAVTGLSLQALYNGTAVAVYAHAGVDPKLMGLGPVPASRLALERAGLSARDLDVIESNEAFTAQACAVTRALELDPAKVNPNGSGISLGHPVGATGVIITAKAICELQRNNGRYALVTMCIGGGQGIAAIFERV
jgi:acetyl-CoA acetyltransferase